MHSIVLKMIIITLYIFRSFHLGFRTIRHSFYSRVKFCPKFSYHVIRKSIGARPFINPVVDYTCPSVVGCMLYAGGVGHFGLLSIVTLSAIAVERYWVITAKPLSGSRRMTKYGARKVNNNVPCRALESSRNWVTI